MKTFTAFRGITPNNVRSRYSDSIFEDQRQRLFGNSTISGDYELSIPGANITQYDEDERNGYLIELAAPGYDKNDFNINVHNDVLTISGELGEDRVRTRDSFHRQEYNYHTFSRSWNLPESVDEDNITANYRNGLLEVFIPVMKPAEETKTPRRIAVG
ncbi:Hsp20/alpha crystallin family protein [Neolewinella aurantiaca]|uniref:Hsp20/alpha crystallin family protein n=1 Tax=Neolewinella aurantiaca TaxID=2602767 RepID=A0A5C7FSV2_9BACT|nr:Hsp20/alpha crystallin family protein [Neolewinella aurantiaca]TXF87794.1 Hsp20/alpha crystallin family protein [Neolewinella aurantiaca]